MKRVYWRPKSVSRTALLLISAFAILGMVLVEQFPTVRQMPWQAEKMEAAQLAKSAFDVIAVAREQSGEPIEPKIDPTESGLLGISTSNVTSLTGSLPAKQTTINPNFAAAVVQILKDAGVKKGDVVAVGVSGSFPAMNICTYAALETLETQPIVIGSGASSSWGANLPNLLWLDMEKILADDDVFATRAIAASVGGEADRGLAFPREGVEAIRGVIEENGIQLLNEKKFEKILEQRMEIYRQSSGGKPIAAYINVGGGMASTGRTAGKEAFKSGLNEEVPDEAVELDGIMERFGKAGVPVIHLVKISSLAKEFGLPESPQTMPQVGEGGVFKKPDYNRWLALAILLIEMALLYLFIRSDVGFRLLRPGTKRGDQSAPEPMV